VRASKTFTRLFELRLLHLGSDVSVFEREIGNTLPSCCPERHINPDGSFCIGLRAGEGITAETAPAWWDKLHAFALCQETAEAASGPTEAQLSHGAADEVELAAENAADQLGLRAVYREAVAFDTGLIALFKLPQLDEHVDMGGGPLSISRYFTEMLDPSMSWDDGRRAGGRPRLSNRHAC